jgi:hypothetical protein
VGGPTLANRKPVQNNATELPDLRVKRRLAHNLQVAQELVEARHNRVVAVFLQSGERPPDPGGIARLRSLIRDLQKARKALIVATSRWHYFMFRRRVPAPSAGISPGFS